MTLSVCLEEGAFKQLGRNDATSGGLCLSLQTNRVIPLGSCCFSPMEMLPSGINYNNDSIPLTTTTLSGPT